MADITTGESLDATQAGSQDPNAEGDATQQPAGQLDHQKEIERIVSERLARERRKFAKEMEAMRAETLESFRESHGLTDEMLESLTKKDKTALELKKKAREYEALEAAHKKTRARLEKETIGGSILRAATGKSTSPELIVRLLRDQVALDEDLTPYTHDNGEPMGLTIEQLVDDFLTKHKELAAPRNITPGAGSRVTDGGNGETKYDLKTPEGRKAAALLAFSKAGL